DAVLHARVVDPDIETRIEHRSLRTLAVGTTRAALAVGGRRRQLEGLEPVLARRVPEQRRGHDELGRVVALELHLRARVRIDGELLRLDQILAQDLRVLRPDLLEVGVQEADVRLELVDPDLHRSRLAPLARVDVRGRDDRRGHDLQIALLGDLGGRRAGTGGEPAREAAQGHPDPPVTLALCSVLRHGGHLQGAHTMAPSSPSERVRSGTSCSSASAARIFEESTGITAARRMWSALRAPLSTSRQRSAIASMTASSTVSCTPWAARTRARMASTFMRTISTRTSGRIGTSGTTVMRASRAGLKYALRVGFTASTSSSW